MRVHRWLGAAGVVAVLASACAASAAPTARVATTFAATIQPTIPAGAAPAIPLALVVGGIARTLADGDAVPLSGELVASVRLTPGAGRFGRAVDLFLHHGRGADTPVDGAMVSVFGEMLHMEHGSFRGAAQPGSAGHYLVALPFPMPGEWRVNLQIDAPGQKAAMLLELVVLD